MARDKTDKTERKEAIRIKKELAAQEVWSKVYWAYANANPPNLRSGHAAQLGAIASKWNETRDTSFMDAAISYCHEQKLPILPELLEHVYAAMVRRINDGNSPKKAFAYSVKERLFEEMAKLIYHGATLERAAQLMAYFSSMQTAHSFKASTLEKDFPEYRRRFTDFEKLLFEDPHLTEAEKAKTRKKFRAVIDDDFDISDDIKGERR